MRFGEFRNLESRKKVELIRGYCKNLCSPDPRVSLDARDALLQITHFCKQFPLTERDNLLITVVTSVIHVARDPASWQHGEKILYEIPRQSGYHLVGALVGERREFAGKLIAKRPEHSLAYVIRGLSHESGKIRDGCRWLLSRPELGKHAAQSLVYSLFDSELRGPVTKFLSNEALSRHVAPHLEWAVSTMKPEWRNAATGLLEQATKAGGKHNQN